MGKLTKKDKIYLEAAKLFKTHGYQASTMRQLAKEVGLEAASLYSHISSKQEILSNICLSEADKFLDMVNTLLTEKKSIMDMLKEISYFQFMDFSNVRNALICTRNSISKIG